MHTPRLLTLPLALLLACDGGDSAQDSALSCTEIGCTDGFTLQMTATDPGTWVVALTLDGEPVTCTAILPFPESLDALGCDDERVSMTFSGTALDDSQHALGDLWISTTPATVDVQVTHNDTVVFTQTFTPAYTEVAPNGEDCGPVCYNDSDTIGTL